MGAGVDFKRNNKKTLTKENNGIIFYVTIDSNANLTV